MVVVKESAPFAKQLIHEIHELDLGVQRLTAELAESYSVNEAAEVQAKKEGRIKKALVALWRKVIEYAKRVGRWIADRVRAVLRWFQKGLTAIRGMMGNSDGFKDRTISLPVFNYGALKRTIAILDGVVSKLTASMKESGSGIRHWLAEGDFSSEWERNLVFELEQEIGRAQEESKDIIEETVREVRVSVAMNMYFTGDETLPMYIKECQNKMDEWSKAAEIAKRAAARSVVNSERSRIAARIYQEAVKDMQKLVMDKLIPYLLMTTKKIKKEGGAALEQTEQGRSFFLKEGGDHSHLAAVLERAGVQVEMRG